MTRVPGAATSVTDLTLAKDMPAAPVTWLKRDRKLPEDGVGLCLSGGGLRAMLFHGGALLRMYELELLKDVRRVSSVSGGSIAAGVLALNWRSLLEQRSDRTEFFITAVIDPLRSFARRRIDLFAWLAGTLLPGTSPVQRLAAALDDHLYQGAKLADLPLDPPRFIFNATNVATGVLWRFSRPYMADYRLGQILNPDLRLSIAVAASSAFPPFFSPLRLRLDPDSYVEEEQAEDDVIKEPELRTFRAEPRLADGGVYDNLALETVWKRFRDVLVSDGGGAFGDDARPPTDLIFQTVRVMKTIDRQVRALRRNVLVRSYQEPPTPGGLFWRRGAYWGIRTQIADYKVDDPLDCPPEHVARLAAVPTRLWKMNDLTQQRLVNWGYAVCDAAIRAYYRNDKPLPARFPYPSARLG